MADWGNSKEGSLGEGMGDIETILKNYTLERSHKQPGSNGYQMYDPNYDINSYKTQGLDLNTLNSLSRSYFGQAQGNLYGQMQRAAGGAGALASNQAFASGVSNPYAFGSHAQNGVYGQYAGAFGGLHSDFLKQMMQNPMMAYQSQLGANQSNFGNLYQLLALKMGMAGQRDSGIAPQLVGGAMSIAGSAAGAGAFGGGGKNNV